jgi:hypothetical protein
MIRSFGFQQGMRAASKKAELYKIGYEEQPDPRDRILSVNKVDDDHLAQAVGCFHTSKDQLLSMLHVSPKAASI